MLKNNLAILVILFFTYACQPKPLSTRDPLYNANNHPESSIPGQIDSSNRAIIQGIQSVPKT